VELVATFIEKSLFVLEPEIRESEADALPLLLVRLDAIQGGGDDDIINIEVAMILFPLCLSCRLLDLLSSLIKARLSVTGGGVIGFLRQSKTKKFCFRPCLEPMEFLRPLEVIHSFCSSFPSHKPTFLGH
jgi:hypothetical protein